MTDAMPNPDLFRGRAAEAARFLKRMANEHRLMILCRLGGGEMTAGALQALIPLSQSALSQHLAVLREDGLVAWRREGQNIHYRIADPRVAGVIAALAGIICPKD